jgi:hypothetical protein
VTGFDKTMAMGNIKACHLCDHIGGEQQADGSDVRTFCTVDGPPRGADSPPPNRKRSVSDVQNFMMT